MLKQMKLPVGFEEGAENWTGAVMMEQLALVAKPFSNTQGCGRV